MENSLTIGLFDPGMTHLHRVGLAGLYMTLDYFKKQKMALDGVRWETNRTYVHFEWKENTRFFDRLFKSSFNIKNDGLIQFACHNEIGLGNIEHIQFHNAILDSFLQHNKQNMIPKGTNKKKKFLDFGEHKIAVTYRPLVGSYAHRIAAKDIQMDSGALAKRVIVKGWLFPGAAERHSNLTGTHIEESPAKALCLIFAPVASIFFRIFHRSIDAKIDKRCGTAIVLPHVSELDSYSKAYQRYLESPIEYLSADSLGDAGLNALLTMKSEEKLSDIGISGCSAIMMGTVGWSSQQKTRTNAIEVKDGDENMLNIFELARACFLNKIVIKVTNPTKKDPNPYNKYFVATSLCRGAIAENIAGKREWYSGFSELIKTKKRSRLVLFEKGGLKEMIEKSKWNEEADRKFVEAVHVAINHRYGALAARASQKGERIPFDREYERMRTGLMRSKNAQTLRAELADLFARGGINKNLQENWVEILPLFNGSDWQKAKDLALLALASYTGKGAEEVEKEATGDEEEE